MYYRLIDVLQLKRATPKQAVEEVKDAVEEVKDAVEEVKNAALVTPDEVKASEAPKKKLERTLEKETNGIVKSINHTVTVNRNTANITSSMVIGTKNAMVRLETLFKGFKKLVAEQLRGMANQNKLDAKTHSDAIDGLRDRIERDECILENLHETFTSLSESVNGMKLDVRYLVDEWTKEGILASQKKDAARVDVETTHTTKPHIGRLPDLTVKFVKRLLLGRAHPAWISRVLHIPQQSVLNMLSGVSYIYVAEELNDELYRLTLDDVILLPANYDACYAGGAPKTKSKYPLSVTQILMLLHLCIGGTTNGDICEFLQLNYNIISHKLGLNYIQWFGPEQLKDAVKPYLNAMDRQHIQRKRDQELEKKKYRSSHCGW